MVKHFLIALETNFFVLVVTIVSVVTIAIAIAIIIFFIVCPL